jgi:hypothetical protein
MTAEMKHLLKDLRPPTPPPELRERTLRAALDARERKSRPDRWAQIWHSRPLRYAWATTVAGLLLAHVLISTTQRPSPDIARGFALHQASRTSEEEIRDIATLLRLDLEARSLAGAAAAAAASQNTSESTAPIEKENA